VSVLSVEIVRGSPGVHGHPPHHSYRRKEQG
jgi:hypothetical protein